LCTDLAFHVHSLAVMARKIFTRDFWFQDMDSVLSANRVVCLLILGFVCLQLWLGAEFHYVEECYSSEYDRYVEKADRFREGTIPRDPYHPLLYPLLTAVMSHVLGSTFAAARLISTLSGGALLFFTYMLALRCFGLRTAVTAAVWLAFNSLFILFGLMTTTDMVFSALALMCLYFSVRVSEDDALGPLVLMGVSFGLAYFTRYAAAALLPNVFLALWLCPLSSAGQRIRRLTIVASVIVLTLIPHFAMTASVFGSPLYHENSKNLVRKVFGVDLERDKPVGPLESVASIVFQSPGQVAASALGTVDTWLGQGTLAYVAGNRQFLVAAVFVSAFLAGVYVIVVARNKGGEVAGQREKSIETASVSARYSRVLVLAYAAVYFSMMCVFIEPFSRLLLPILPVLLMTAAYYLAEIALPGTMQVRGVSLPVALPPLIIVLVMQAWGIPQALRESAQRHPYHELEAARLLEEKAGTGIVVMGSFPFMQRYVTYRYHHLNDDGFLAVPHTSSEYFRRLQQTVRENKANFVIFGRPSLGNRPEDLLSGRGAPQFLELVFRGNQVAVYRVRGD
jgi:4-amino-4-deoxy-L-arabinose transferase-like glycosyltransferase